MILDTVNTITGERGTVEIPEEIVAAERLISEYAEKHWANDWEFRSIKARFPDVDPPEI